MSADELEKLMADLTAWCEAQYGRQSELAKELGVSKQLVTNWIAGRRTPTLKDYFKLRDFLKGKR